jgi:hypothetical protein
LIGETVSTLGVPIGPVLKLIYPCLQDLEQGCTALTALRDDYGELPEQQRLLANAISVFLAENDSVVDPARFPGDPVPDQIEGRGHIDVCKPNRAFLDPVSRLSSVCSTISRIKATHAFGEKKE